MSSTHNSMQSHLQVFTEFCHSLCLRPFPVHVQTILRYIAFLSATGRSYGTVQNHIASIKHFDCLLGFPPGCDHSYSFQLALHGSKRFIGSAPACKLPTIRKSKVKITFAYGLFVGPQ